MNTETCSTVRTTQSASEGFTGTEILGIRDLLLDKFGSKGFRLKIDGRDLNTSPGTSDEHPSVMQYLQESDTKLDKLSTACRPTLLQESIKLESLIFTPSTGTAEGPIKGTGLDWFEQHYWILE